MDAVSVQAGGDQRPNFYGTLNAPPELFLVLCSTGYDISMNTKKWCQSAMDSPIFQREEEGYPEFLTDALRPA